MHADPSQDDPSQRVQHAVDRLAGQLVRTPLVGGLLLGSEPASPRLRAKLEVLQPGGSAWFRGAMYSLGRHLGSLTGLVVGGGFRQAYATAVAASVQRIQTVVLLDPEVPAARAARFDGLPHVQVERGRGDRAAVEERAGREGWRPAPGVDDADWRLGVASLGWELGEQVPGDTDVVVVGPEAFLEPVEVGLRARGSEVAVVAADEEPPPAEREAWRREVREGLRVDSDLPGLRALWSARLRATSGEDVVAVLGA